MSMRLSAASDPVTLDRGPYPVPASPEALIALRDRIARDPHGGAAIALLALIAWQADPAIGAPLLVLAVSERNVAAGTGPGSYHGYVLSSSVRELLRIFERSKDGARSYAAGATPDNRYQLDPAAVTLRFHQRDRPELDRPSPTQHKVFIHSSGADSPRPITMAVNKHGIWKADELSSLFVGVRPMAPLPGGVDPADHL